MSKRNSKSQNKNEESSKVFNYPSSQKMDFLFKKFIEKNNEENEKIRKEAKSVANKRVKEKILKRAKNVSMNTTFKYDLNGNEKTKNNPYYYDLKNMSNDIIQLKKTCLDLENKVNSYCVYQDSKAFEEFKKLQINTIKLNDNINYIKDELKDLSIKNHELNKRINNDEYSFKKTLLKNQEINQFISQFKNLNNNLIKNQSYDIYKIN